MHPFRNILVGVDLYAGGPSLSSILSPPTAEAVDRSLRLAEVGQSHLCFTTVLDPDTAAERLIHEARGEGTNVFDEAHALLGQLVAKARQQGVSAESNVLLGKSWIRLIQEVLKKNYDLLIVGTRHEGLVDRVLIGSTAIKLLRKCPCPVWIAKPSDGQPLSSTLVAHDLRQVGRHAVNLGVALARSFHLQLTVLHGIEQLPVGDPTGFGLPSGDSERLHHEARERVLMDLELANVDRGSLEPLSPPVQIRTVNGSPERRILDLIQQNAIDLLIMGTVGRSGIHGMLTGNTAERLLSRLQCSLLAIKPEGFECPVERE